MTGWCKPNLFSTMCRKDLGRVSGHQLEVQQLSVPNIRKQEPCHTLARYCPCQSAHGFGHGQNERSDWVQTGFSQRLPGSEGTLLNARFLTPTFQGPAASAGGYFCPETPSSMAAPETIFLALRPVKVKAYKTCHVFQPQAPGKIGSSATPPFCRGSQMYLQPNHRDVQD